MAREEHQQHEHQQRLRLLMAMRRHEFLLELIELAHAQEMAIAHRAQEAEEEQLALALARSLSTDESETNGAPPPMPPVNSVAHVECVHPSMTFAGARGFLLSSDERDGDASGDGGANGLECAVCLAVFEPSDTVRVLPCVHVFHRSCVDKWLERSAACPTCKQRVELDIRT